MADNLECCPFHATGGAGDASCGGDAATAPKRIRYVRDFWIEVVIEDQNGALRTLRGGPAGQGGKIKVKLLARQNGKPEEVGELYCGPLGKAGLRITSSIEKKSEFLR